MHSSTLSSTPQRRAEPQVRRSNSEPPHRIRSRRHLTLSVHCTALHCTVSWSFHTHTRGLCWVFSLFSHGFLTVYSWWCSFCWCSDPPTIQHEDKPPLQNSRFLVCIFLYTWVACFLVLTANFNILGFQLLGIPWWENSTTLISMPVWCNCVHLTMEWVHQRKPARAFVSHSPQRKPRPVPYMCEDESWSGDEDTFGIQIPPEVQLLRLVREQERLSRQLNKVCVCTQFVSCMK
mgnify:CR=1 FL=1